VLVLTSRERGRGRVELAVQDDPTRIYDVRWTAIDADAEAGDAARSWRAAVAKEHPVFGILNGDLGDLHRRLSEAVPSVKLHRWSGHPDRIRDVLCRRTLDAFLCDAVLAPMRPHPSTTTAAALRPPPALPRPIRAASADASASDVLLSVFTTTYRSGAIARVPYDSLVGQTYSRWEWVVYDDSPAGEDETWALLRGLAAADPRVRPFRGAENSGFIGEAKLVACRACRGELLVELDHDDELTPRCLEWIAAAHAAHPDAGFIYTESALVRWDPRTTVNEEDARGDLRCEDFGEGFAWGTGGHCLTSATVAGKARDRVTMLCTPEMGDATLRHIVGVPNHARAWTRVAYDRSGGHNPGLPVADDYELILRTVLTTAAVAAHPVVRVREIGYVQHVSTDPATPNHTRSRNALIQHLVACVAEFYSDALSRLAASRVSSSLTSRSAGCRELAAPNASVDLPGKWAPDPDGRLPLEIDSMADGGEWDVTVVVPTHGRPEKLRAALDSVAAQTYLRWRLVVVGDACPHYATWSRDVFERFRSRARAMIGPPRVWNLVRNRGGAGFAARNYALRHLVSTEWVAYLDDDNTWAPDHLETAFAAMKRAGGEPDFAVASLSIEGRPIVSDRPRKYRTDTSCVVHRRRLVDAHGFWRSQADVGYANDWDLVSRWTDAGVPWVATLHATVLYNAAECPGMREHLLGFHATA